MSEEVEQSSVRAYRMRLLNVLIAQDIRTVKDKLGIGNTGDLTDTKYWLVQNWSASIEDEVLKLIERRLAS